MPKRCVFGFPQKCDILRHNKTNLLLKPDVLSKIALTSFRHDNNKIMQNLNEIENTFAENIVNQILYNLSF